jgi:hypothetical protein
VAAITNASNDAEVIRPKKTIVRNIRGIFQILVRRRHSNEHIMPSPMISPPGGPTTSSRRRYQETNGNRVDVDDLHPDINADIDPDIVDSVQPSV